LTNTIASPTVHDVIVRRKQLLDAAGAISLALGGRVLPHLLQPFQRDRYTAKEMEGALLQLSQAEVDDAPDVTSQLNAARCDLEADRDNIEVAKAAQDTEISANARLRSAAQSTQPVLGSRRKADSIEAATRKWASQGKAPEGSNNRAEEQSRDPAFSAVAAALQNDVHLAFSHLRRWPEQIGDVLRASTVFNKRHRDVAAGIRPAQDAQAIHVIQCVAAVLDPAAALPVVNVHICGESCAGKTMTTQSLIMCATAPARLYNSSPLPDISLENGRTVGVEEHSVEWALRQGSTATKVRLRIHDYGGREGFWVNHAAHHVARLASPHSVYLFVVPLWDKRPGDTHDQPMELENAVELYRAWLKLINTVVPLATHKAPVVTVVNFATRFQRAVGGLQQAVIDRLLDVQNSFDSQRRFAFIGSPTWLDSNIPGRTHLELVPVLNRAFDTLPRSLSQETPALQAVLADTQVKNKWPVFTNETCLQARLRAVIRQMHTLSTAQISETVVVEGFLCTAAENTQILLQELEYIAVLETVESELVLLHNPRRRVDQLMQSLLEAHGGSPNETGFVCVVSAGALLLAARDAFGPDAPAVRWDALLKYCTCIPVLVRDGLYTRASKGDAPQWFAFPFLAPHYPTHTATPFSGELIRCQYAVRYPDMSLQSSGYFSQLFVDIAGQYPDTENRIGLFKNALVLEVQAGPTIVIVAAAEGDGFTVTVQHDSNVEGEFQRVRKLITNPSSWRRNVALVET
jgi:hypothetical protein